MSRRVAVITSSFPRDERDIAGRFVLEQLQALRRLDPTLRFEVFCWQDAEGRGCAGSAPIPGIRTHWVRYFGPRRRDQRLFFGAGAPENLAATPRWQLAVQTPAALAAMLATVLAHHHRSPFDLLMGHWLVPGGLIARLAGTLLNRPSLVVGHSGGLHLIGKLPSSARRPMVHFLNKGPITVPTDTLAHRWRGLGGGEAMVLPMGFWPAAEAKRPGEVEQALEERPPGRGEDWATMGRLVPIKGVDRAVEAFCRARPRGARLHVLGDGPMRGELEALARQQGGAGRVIFHGVVRGAARDEVLRRCSFFLMPSRQLPDGRHEGLPVSLLEAAAVGAVPVVSAELRGCEHLLVRPTLQRLPPSPQAWPARLEALAAVGRAELEGLRQASRQLALALSWEVLGPRWLAVLEEAIAR